MTKKALFLTTVLPRHQRMGSEVASQAFIDGLSHCGYQVTVAGYMRLDDTFLPSRDEVVIAKRYIETRKSKIFTLIWLFLSLIYSLPYSAQKYISRQYIQTVKELTTSNDYDWIIIDHPQLGWLERHIEPKERLVTIAHNIEHEIYLSNAKATRNPLSRWIYQREARLIKAMEDHLACLSAATWTLTDHDAKYFASLASANPVIPFGLPPGLHSSPTQHIPKQFDIALIGSWAWKPNEEGLRWFLDRVYPQLSDMTIHIAGRGAEWLVEKYPQITYRGFVPDAQIFMAQAKAVAIPTLSGGGVQIKTLDAIASGSPIVATSVALRGISHLPPGVQVADTPEEFATSLKSITQSSETQPIANQATAWLEARTKQFLADLGDAVSLHRKSAIPH